MVSSLHGAAWVKSLHPVFDRYREQPFVSLSQAERQLKPDLNYVATVHNGISLQSDRDTLMSNIINYFQTVPVELMNFTIE